MHKIISLEYFTSFNRHANSINFPPHEFLYTRLNQIYNSISSYQILLNSSKITQSFHNISLNPFKRSVNLHAFQTCSFKLLLSFPNLQLEPTTVAAFGSENKRSFSPSLHARTTSSRPVYLRFPPLYHATNGNVRAATCKHSRFCVVSETL